MASMFPNWIETLHERAGDDAGSFALKHIGGYCPGF